MTQTQQMEEERADGDIGLWLTSKPETHIEYNTVDTTNFRKDRS